MARVRQSTGTITMKQLAPIALLLINACASVETAASAGPEESGTSWVYSSDLTISRPPYEEVHCNWKDRIDQSYVYIECTGPYKKTGTLLPEVHRLLATQGIKPAGPPFALYYDDPSNTAPSKLRSRACVPVGAWTRPAPPLNKDTLPSRTVAYAVASGPYPGVPACYPGVFGYMSKMNWAIAGPIREIYMIPPSEVSSYEDLLCEIQVPVARN